MTNKTFNVPLTFEYEVHDVKQFQKDGHYVGSHIRGDQVHILTLKFPGTKEQALRIQCNDLNECERFAEEAVYSAMFATQRQILQGKFDYDQFLRLHREAGELNTYIRHAYLWEIQQGKHTHLPTSTAVAIHYMAKERGRLWNRIARALWRKPHLEPDIDPDRQQKTEE